MIRQRLRGISHEEWAIGAALAAVAVFLVWSGIRVREIVSPIYQNADVASAPVLAELFSDRGSGDVVLGYYPWYEGLLPLHWTRWVPDHVGFWKAVPFLVLGASVALAGWTVARAVSRRAGLVVALAMAAPAPFVIQMLGVPNQRLPAFAHAIVLAAFLLAAPRLASWEPWKRAAWFAALAITLAPGVASDSLIAISAALPFLVAVGLGWALGLLPRGTALLSAGASAAGILLGRVLERVAEGDGIVFRDDGFELASGERALSNAGLLLEDVALFAHGVFANGTVEVEALAATRELLAVAAAVATVLFAVAIVRAAPGILRDDGRSPEQRLLAIYWGASILAVGTAFVIITAPVGANSVRYVTTFWPALLTLVVILYGRRAVTGLALLAALAALVGCWELKRDYYTPLTGAPPDETEAELVESFVAEHDLDHGYASYWDAMPITLQSEFEALTYPIEPCGPSPDGYCPFQLHYIETWYEPEAGARSFFVVGDPSLKPALDPPPADWGTPVLTARLGDLTLYAFDYDIATRLQPLEPGEASPPRPELPEEPLTPEGAR